MVVVSVGVVVVEAGDGTAISGSVIWCQINGGDCEHRGAVPRSLCLSVWGSGPTEQATSPDTLRRLANWRQKHSTASLAD